jgi:ribonuclease R
LAGCIFDPETALDLAAIAHESSSHERRADEATREVVAWLKCEFMRDKQGHAFSGIVSGVAEFGVFVELDGIFVEGLIHVSALPSDYYRYDAVHHVLRGRSSRHGYRIGQALDVVVARVDLDERKIDFALSESGARRKHRR